jgi:hypothetical protein
MNLNNNLPTPYALLPIPYPLFRNPYLPAQ